MNTNEVKASTSVRKSIEVQLLVKNRCAIVCLCLAGLGEATLPTAAVVHSPSGPEGGAVKHSGPGADRAFHIFTFLAQRPLHS